MGRHKTTKMLCQFCGNEFAARTSDIKKGWGKYCSTSCTAKANVRNQIGANNPNWKGGISTNHYHYKKLQKQRYPKRIRSREALSKAVSAGKVIPECCAVCGCSNTQAHHEDYSKPLDVIWLCAEHHRELHRMT